MTWLQLYWKNQIKFMVPLILISVASFSFWALLTMSTSMSIETDYLQTLSILGTDQQPIKRFIILEDMTGIRRASMVIGGYTVDTRNEGTTTEELSPKNDRIACYIVFILNLLRC